MCSHVYSTTVFTLCTTLPGIGITCLAPDTPMYWVGSRLMIFSDYWYKGNLGVMFTDGPMSKFAAYDNVFTYHTGVGSGVTGRLSTGNTTFYRYGSRYHSNKKIKYIQIPERLGPRIWICGIMVS